MVGFTQVKKCFTISSLGILGCLSVFAHAADDEKRLSAELKTSYNQTLDPKALEAYLGINPELSYKFPTKTSIVLGSVIQRPTDAYKNFEVPKTGLIIKQIFAEPSGIKLAVDNSTTALDLHRWSDEGAMVRDSIGISALKQFENGFSASVRLAPFYQFNKYRLTTAGDSKSRYGVSERLILGYETGRTSFEVTLVTTQRYTNVWKNDYSTEEQIAYQLDAIWSVGISHALLGATVDESTGRYSDLKLFDNRKSQVSAFVGIKM